MFFWTDQPTIFLLWGFIDGFGLSAVSSLTVTGQAKRGIFDWREIHRDVLCSEVLFEDQLWTCNDNRQKYKCD